MSGGAFTNSGGADDQKNGCHSDISVLDLTADLLGCAWILYGNHDGPPNGLRYLRWGGDGEAVQLEK